MNLMKRTALALVMAATAVFAGSAAMALTTCPDVGGYDRYFTLDMDAPATASCYAWGENNDSNDTAFQALLLSDFPDIGLIDKNDDQVSGLLDSTAGLIGGLGGAFSIDLTGLTNVILSLKTGLGQCGQGNDNPCDPGFAAFRIFGSGIVSGEWGVNLKQGLSHFSLYASKDPAPVPLPAALPLLLGGVAGLGFLRRRRSA